MQYFDLISLLEVILIKKKLPDYRLKQKMLYIDKTDPKTLKEFGDLFFNEGNFSDALDFYFKADNSDGMQKIKNTASENGDAMLFQRAAKALKIELKSKDWEAVGQSAISLKKYSFARYALEAAGNNELLTTLQKTMEAEEHKAEI